MSSQENKVHHYFLHADLDAFFASVEQLDHPEYRGKPVIVGGKPEDKRSVVSTASYEARVFGVHSAMPVAKAYQLCPQGIFVHGRMKRYSELSYQIMQIFADFSPDVQQMSIDEAFIDLTGTEKLFGPPQETALKIKERVKAETGLTVSIGLAPTKYLAKLASDMKKPDGFYMIEEGTEENFMLNLPLKKVWGIGDKTYEALKASGLRTTREVHEKSLEALVFMYGQNTGNFLYNVVRGIEVVNFERKTKSHSISNETTFPFDLSNIYTAETAILDLCHSVIFRLLKENGFSRTVQVKIRYEDFSTVSIQQTYSYSILTLDSLYSAAKELFEKKYERGRGIRLIGIALENIEKTERSYQPSLFDDGSEKKQNVEKAILKLEKKHPEIKIHKARMLENLGKGVKVLIATAGLLALSIFGSDSAFAQEIEEKESTYEISGSWTGQMKGNVDITFGEGNPFGISSSLPVFDQEVDLSALIHITPQFYFEMEFLDQFNNNTYTLGYNGDGYLNEFKFSNRNITFPDYYSSSLTGYSLSGGQNQAPGIMLHFDDFENRKWSGDFLLRYDMTEQKTALFYGNKSVNDTNTQLYSFVHSSEFVIPGDAVFHIREVYIQSKQGNYLNTKGVKFQKLTSQEYVIDNRKNLLVISDSVWSITEADTIPYIIITFDDDSYCNTLLQETGSYSDPLSFVGRIQDFFNTSADSQINLSDYFTLDYDSITMTINNSTAYIIQSNQNFSPYLCANKYIAYKNAGTEFLVQNKNTSITQNDFFVKLQDDFYFTRNDYFDEKQNYALVHNRKYINETNDIMSPVYRYPFAAIYPQIYLDDYEDDKTEDDDEDGFELVFTQRAFSTVQHYDIGKKASAGSVRVYKNGVLITTAVYDSGTGFVLLNEEVNELDKIYIVYEEESSDSENGFVTTGTGFVYNILPALVFDVSFGGKYQALQEEASQGKTTFSALTSGLSYKGKNLNIWEALSTAIETQAQTDAAFITKNQAGLKYQKDSANLEASSSVGLALDTKTGKKSSDYVNTNVKGSWSIFGIKLGTDMALSYLDLLSAGHLVKTESSLFKFVDFEEIYRFTQEELEKKDYVSFNTSGLWGNDAPFKFNLSAQASANNSQLLNKQNYLAESTSTLNIASSSHSGTIKFSADQQKMLDTTNIDTSPQFTNTNYFTSWYDISQNQFSSGQDKAQRKEIFYAQYKSNYKPAKLSPQISFEISGDNKNNEELDFLTSDILNLTIPFSTRNNAFSINLTRSQTILTANSTNKDYGQDISSIFENQKDFSFIYKTIPLYSFFDKEAEARIFDKGNSGSGNIEYNFLWRRKLFNDIKDLYIPLSAATGISRDITYSQCSQSDIYQLKTKLTLNFINLFGSDSLLQTFDWYRQDEYTGFLSVIFKLTPDTSASPDFQISSGELLTFYIQDSNTLTVTTDFYIDNYINWSFKTSAAYNRKTEKSLLLALTHLCWQNSKTMNLSPAVKDTISISLSTQNKTNKQIYSYLRTSEITFLKNFNLSSGAGLSFGYEEDKTFRLGLNYELGLKISF